MSRMVGIRIRKYFIFFFAVSIRTCAYPINNDLVVIYFNNKINLMIFGMIGHGVM